VLFRQILHEGLDLPQCVELCSTAGDRLTHPARHANVELEPEAPTGFEPVYAALQAAA
jgi:hypothetical protein